MTDSRCVIDFSGTKRWLNKSGGFHRIAGPAVEWANGDTSWWIDGQRHRLDGPAAEWSGHGKGWWVLGKSLSEQQFDQHPLVIFYRLSTEHR